MSSTIDYDPAPVLSIDEFGPSAAPAGDTADDAPSTATAAQPDLAALEARLDRKAIRRDGWTIVIFALAAVGLTQKVTAKDGFALAQPYDADTILVGPGERYTVLVHADNVGTWVWHCHILSHAESDKGMFGMVTAMVVQA